MRIYDITHNATKVRVFIMVELPAVSLSSYSAGTLVRPNTEELISELLVGQNFWPSLTGHTEARYIAWSS